MTNEEAITILTLYRAKIVNSVSIGIEEDVKAYDMALKALEQADGDIINKFRDYQIEWLTSHNDIDLHETEMWVVQFLKDTAECFLKELPSAEKTAECDNNHDCEHCNWTECPLEVEKEKEEKE